MKTGFNSDNIPAQPSPEHKIVKIKTFGRVENDPPQPKNNVDNSSNKKREAQRELSENNKRFADMLEKSAAMRHLEYEIIEDAKMIQIKVVNTNDGEIVRKIPPDKVIDIVRKIRQNKNKRLDVRA